MIEHTQNIFNWADYVIIAIVAISVLISLIRGFVREVLSLATWIVALLLAFKFCGKLAVVFAPYTQNASLRLAVSFAILFLIVLILGGLIGYLIGVLISKAKLGFIDRTLGMIFGIARGILVIAVLLLLITMSSSGKPDAWWTQSYLIPHFQGMVKWMHGFLPQEIEKASHAASSIIHPHTKS